MDIIKTYYAGKTILYKRHSKGNYRKGGKHRKPTRPLSEKQKKSNLNRAAFECTKILNSNFNEDDYWFTLTYEESCFPEDLDAARGNLRKFLRSLRTIYKKSGGFIKYVCCTEFSEEGRLHHHMVISSLGGQIEAKAIEEKWRYGFCYSENLYDQGNYADLAQYIVKKDYWEENGGVGKKWFASRNIERPEEEILEAPSMKVIPEITESPGYYVDPKTIREGISAAGYLYQSYIEVELPLGLNKNDIYGYVKND